MSAIFKREFKSYFTTPIGYVVLAAFYFFLGLFFVNIYSAGAPDITSIVIAMATIIILVLPILTMRIMSDDRRQKVDQALLTAPVKLTSIVLGKFLAAFAVFAIGFIPTIIFEIIIMSHVTVNIMSFAYALLGVLLLGGTIIAIGMFISSLTESAVISAFLTLFVNIIMLFNISAMIPIPSGESKFMQLITTVVTWFVSVLDQISFINRFNQFGDNIFSVADVFYFLSVTAIFLFLCVRSLEKRRWA